LLVERRDVPLSAALADLKASPGELAHVKVAEAYVRVGVLDMAYDHFTEAVRFNRRSVAALDGRARLLRDVGLMNMALVDVHRALYVAPGSAIARNTLGTILERLGQCREARAAYRKAAQLSNGATWAAQNVTRLTLSCPGQ
jgi:Flp pilus assembly protein TadD